MCIVEVRNGGKRVDRWGKSVIGTGGSGVWALVIGTEKSGLECPGYDSLNSTTRELVTQF